MVGNVVWVWLFGSCATRAGRNEKVFYEHEGLFMKKTLITLALSALSLAAIADVTLYGEIKGGLEYKKIKRVEGDLTSFSDWGSFVGFKGEEDLGGDLKAIWQIEQDVSVDNQGEHWATRDSFIGLTGSFGTLRIGYLSDVFKENLETLDQWSGNDFRTLSSFTRYSDNFVGVRYDSPNFSGFSFNLTYSPKDNSPKKHYDMLSLGLGYENSGWFVNYGFKNIHGKYLSGTGKKLNTMVHGLDFGYDSDTWFAGLGYRYARHFENRGIRSNSVAFTVAYTLGNIVPRISFSYAEDTAKKQSFDKKIQVIAGADYNLSKRTAVLSSVGYHRLRVGDVGKLETYSLGLGLRHKF